MHGNRTEGPLQTILRKRWPGSLPSAPLLEYPRPQLADAAVEGDVEGLLLQGDEAGFRHHAEQGQEGGRHEGELHRGGAAPVAAEAPGAAPGPRDRAGR